MPMDRWEGLQVFPGQVSLPGLLDNDGPPV